MIYYENQCSYVECSYWLWFTYIELLSLLGIITVCVRSITIVGLIQTGVNRCEPVFPILPLILNEFLTSHSFYFLPPYDVMS